MFCLKIYIYFLLYLFKCILLFFFSFKILNFIILYDIIYSLIICQYYFYEKKKKKKLYKKYLS
jgi:hypothetical protein